MGNAHWVAFAVLASVWVRTEPVISTKIVETGKLAAAGSVSRTISNAPPIRSVLISGCVVVALAKFRRSATPVRATLIVAPLSIVESPQVSAQLLSRVGVGLTPVVPPGCRVRGSTP